MASEHNGSQDSEHINQIIRQIKDGDTEKFRLIIEKYQKRIYLYSCYLLQDKEQAEDAVQDIFIKAFRYIGSYSPTVSFSAWIHKIAYNHSVNLNKKKLRDHQMVRDVQDLYAASAAVPYKTNDIEELLEPLSFNEKYILLMRAVEEYSYEEIGHVLNISPANARKKYERIRKKLMKQKNGGYGHEQALRATRE